MGQAQSEDAIEVSLTLAARTRRTFGSEGAVPRPMRQYLSQVGAGMGRAGKEQYHLGSPSRATMPEVLIALARWHVLALGFGLSAALAIRARMRDRRIVIVQDFALPRLAGSFLHRHGPRLRPPLRRSPHWVASGSGICRQAWSFSTRYWQRACRSIAQQGQHAGAQLGSYFDADTPCGIEAVKIASHRRAAQTRQAVMNRGGQRRLAEHFHDGLGRRTVHPCDEAFRANVAALRSIKPISTTGAPGYAAAPLRPCPWLNLGYRKRQMPSLGLSAAAASSAPLAGSCKVSATSP